MRNQENFTDCGTAAPTGTASTTRKKPVTFTVVETVQAPRLEGITTPDFVEFRDKRKVYESRLAGDNPDPFSRAQLASYRNSMSPHVLQILVHAGLVDATSIEKVTEEDLRNCVEKQARVEFKDYDLAIIEHHLRDVKMGERASYSTLEVQMMDLSLRYSETLRKWGYDLLIERTPFLAVEHLMARITHSELKRRMMRIIKLRKPDRPKDSFSWFLKELFRQAREIDRFDFTEKRDSHRCDFSGEGVVVQKKER